MTSRKNQEMIMKERLVRERDNLLREREALENKIAGLELAISLVEDQEVEVLQANGKRVATKSIVLELLKDVGLTGLNATVAIEMASRRGISLDKASVSSLLSRLKKEETLDYDGDKYRLKELNARASSDASRLLLNTIPSHLVRVRDTNGKIHVVRRPSPPPMPPSTTN